MCPPNVTLPSPSESSALISMGTACDGEGFMGFLWAEQDRGIQLSNGVITFNASVIGIRVPLKQDLQQSTDTLTSRLRGGASFSTILTSGMNPAAKYFHRLPKSLFSNRLIKIDMELATLKNLLENTWNKLRQ